VYTWPATAFLRQRILSPFRWSTRLRFQETRTDVPTILAFAIPRNYLLRSKEWVRERVPLLDRQTSPRVTPATSPSQDVEQGGYEDVVFFPARQCALVLLLCDADNNILKIYRVL